MNSNLRLLLQLQELNLLHQGLTLVGAYGEEAGSDHLEKRIERVRRRVPGPMLSHYDSLSRAYLEPMTAVSQSICHACGGNIPAKLATELNEPNRSRCCPHCRRFLYEYDRSPDYLGTK